MTFFPFIPGVWFKYSRLHSKNTTRPKNFFSTITGSNTDSDLRRGPGRLRTYWLYELFITDSNPYIQFVSVLNN